MALLMRFLLALLIFTVFVCVITLIVFAIWVRIQPYVWPDKRKGVIVIAKRNKMNWLSRFLYRSMNSSIGKKYRVNLQNDCYSPVACYFQTIENPAMKTTIESYNGHGFLEWCLETLDYDVLYDVSDHNSHFKTTDDLILFKLWRT